MRDNSKRTRKKCLSAAIASLVASGFLATASAAEIETDLGILQLAKPLKPTDALVEQAVEARKKFGFKHDPAYVRDLLTRSQTIAEIVSLEGELTRRQADLDSLKQRRE